MLCLRDLFLRFINILHGEVHFAVEKLRQKMGNRKIDGAIFPQRTGKFPRYFE